MNYIEHEINKLIKERNRYLKSGIDAFKAYNSFASSALIKLVIQRDLHRVKELNDKIFKLKQQNTEFKALVDMKPINKSLK